MGVPVVALAGASHAGRMSASVLKNIGYSSWIASTIDEYINLSQWLAGNIEQLSETRMELRNRMQESSLFDYEGFAVNLERIYRCIWIKWCRSSR